MAPGVNDAAAFGAVSSGQVTLLHTRLLSGQAQAVQVWFDAAVLDKYRSMPGARVMRTNTLGRVKAAQWSVDFGITEAPAAAGSTAASGSPRVLVHLSLADAQARIPEGERQHWADHAVSLPASANYLTLQLSKGMCIDDGELRDW